MELLFIDESGDNGFAKGSTEFFSLAGISVKSKDWKNYYWKIDELRTSLFKKYGLRFDELKGAEIFAHRGPLFNSSVTAHQDVLWIYEQFIELICDPMTNLFVTSLSKELFRKQQNQTTAKSLIKNFNKKIWLEYLSMYNKYLFDRSKGYDQEETGLIYSDMNKSQEKYIRGVIRNFSRRFDQEVKFSGAGIIEDVIFRDSKESKFIQLADILAYSVNKMLSGRGPKDVIGIRPKIHDALQNKMIKPAISL